MVYGQNLSCILVITGNRQIKAGVAQLVEHQPSKLRVAGSSLVSRSYLNERLMIQSVSELRSKCQGVTEFLTLKPAFQADSLTGSHLIANVAQG